MSDSICHFSASCLLPSPFDEHLIREAAIGCRMQIGGDPDLVIVLVTPDYQPSLSRLIETLRIDGHASRIVGGSACGLAGVGREQELTSGISMLFLRLPATVLATDTTATPAEMSSGSILFTHPLRVSFEECLTAWTEKCPDVPLVGGAVTGGPETEDLFLFNETGKIDSGTLAIHFTGGISIKPLVAPGCRPIGEPLVVTKANGQEILQLGRREPYEVLEEVFSSLGADLQFESAGHIFAGVAISEEVQDFQSGDFHVHQIIGATLEDGRLRLESPVRTGQTVQFQLRDPLAAEMALRTECERIHEAWGTPFATLLFLGKGRGKKLFGVEDRNVQAFEEVFGRVPLAGLYSFGELGPAHSTTIRHNHSVCGALFYPVKE